MERSGLGQTTRFLPLLCNLREEHSTIPVVLVTKDINLRIKASIAGIPAEDYENDRALDDFSLLYAGHNELPSRLLGKHAGSALLVRAWAHLLRNEDGQE
jgi:predicted ribonuclease YlaK